MFAGNPLSGHAYWMDLSELPKLSRPPDPELVDLIEREFLEGQIDGMRSDLAYSWLSTYETSSRFAQISA